MRLPDVDEMNHRKHASHLSLHLETINDHRKSAPIPPSLMPPEPHIEMNKSYVCPPSGQKYENQTYKVTVKNQSNNSQRINLLGPVIN